MVACFSGNAGRLSSQQGALAVYHFDNNKGKIDTKPVCELKGRPGTDLLLMMYHFPKMKCCCLLFFHLS